MGWPFVRRRMAAELGAGLARAGSTTSSSTPRPPPRSARSTAPTALDGRKLACKLQYPDIASAVEADLTQLAPGVRPLPPLRRLDRSRARSTTRSPSACARSSTTRREAKHMALYRAHAAATSRWSHVPDVAAGALERAPADHDLARRPPAARAFTGLPQEERNRLADNMFRAWYVPFYDYRA